MNDDNITKLISNNFKTQDALQNEQDLYNDILDVINDYQGKISLVSALGILDLAKDELKMQAKDK